MKIVDMHCDTISRLLEKRRAGEAEVIRENTGHLDVIRMQRSGYLLQNFALFVNSRTCGDVWEELCSLYEVYREELTANEDILAPVSCYADIAANEGAGKLSTMLTVEEGAVCGGDLRKLHRLYEMGVRMLTLTWNHPNELGHPHSDCEKGLTGRGREFVVEMERLGVIVDVSHLSDAGFYDVLESTRKPFVASHSNAREVCPVSRNLTDDMICRLAQCGGCIGLNYYANFLERKPAGEPNPGTIEAIVRHAKHIVKVGGIEVLGLGSDFDGIDTHAELPGAQSMELLWEALHRAGFAQAALDKIFHENVLRVYRDCLA